MLEHAGCSVLVVGKSIAMCASYVNVVKIHYVDDYINLKQIYVSLPEQLPRVASNFVYQKVPLKT